MIVRKNERELEAKLVSDLRQAGENVRTQVTLPIGRVDVVTDHAVYEVKKKPNTSEFFRAIGQVLSYRALINPKLRAIIASDEIDQKLWLLADCLGVECLAVEPPAEWGPTSLALSIPNPSSEKQENNDEGKSLSREAPIATRSWLAINEAAGLLEISTRAVVRSLKAGGISGFKIDGMWRIPRQGFFEKYPWSRELQL